MVMSVVTYYSFTGTSNGAPSYLYYPVVSSSLLGINELALHIYQYHPSNFTALTQDACLAQLVAFYNNNFLIEPLNSVPATYTQTDYQLFSMLIFTALNNALPAITNPQITSDQRDAVYAQIMGGAPFYTAVGCQTQPKQIRG